MLLLSVNFKNVLTKPVSEWEKSEKIEESSDEGQESSEQKDELETEKSPSTPDASPSPNNSYLLTE